MAEASLPRAAAAIGRGTDASRAGRSRVAMHVAFACVVAVVSSALAVWKVPANAVLVVETHGPAHAAPAVAALVHAHPAAPAPRVLLIGDSVMDQQGNHAAFELRQAGITTQTVGLWGSSMLTRDQYDFGHTVPNSGWFHRAAGLIASFRPDVVAVYLDHNYWPPYPRDAAGNVIDGQAGLWTPAGQAMLRTQASALVTILRAHGARVYFVAPIPAGTFANPDPGVWSPIWHGYQQVLTAMHVPVIDSSAGLRGADGLRVETKPSCTGEQQRIRPPDDLHLTRYGAGLAGTALATAVARAVDGNLAGNGAPGDHTAALVPAPSGSGYWLVGCDGSVYHFGGAAHLPGARAQIVGHHGVAAAAATPDGKGLWLVATDGTVVAVGDAPPMTLRTRPASAISAASSTADGKGLVATTVRGAVHVAGTARSFGSLAGRNVNGTIVDIELTHDAKGYWLVGTDGGVFSFGDAHFYGSTGGARLTGSIVGMAATPDGKGYWQVGADGGVFAFGDARFLGTARWATPAYPFSLFTLTPGPAVDIVAAPGTKQGYWVVGDTGRVTNLGAAAGHAGDNSLALRTQ